VTYSGAGEISNKVLNLAGIVHSMPLSAKGPPDASMMLSN